MFQFRGATHGELQIINAYPKIKWVPCGFEGSLLLIFEQSQGIQSNIILFFSVQYLLLFTEKGKKVNGTAAAQKYFFFLFP